MDVTLPSSLQSITKNNISFGDVIISFPYDLSRDDSQNHADLSAKHSCQLKFNLEFIGPFLFFTKSTIINAANPMTLKILTNNFPTFVVFIPNFIIKNSTRLSLNQNNSKNHFSVTLQPKIHLFSTTAVQSTQLPKNINRQVINVNSYCYFIDEFVITFNSSDHMNEFITSFSSFTFNYQVSIMNCPEKELCKIGNVNCVGAVVNKNSTNYRRNDCIYINKNFKVSKESQCNLVLVRIMDIYSIQIHGIIPKNNTIVSSNSDNNNNYSNDVGKNDEISCLLDLPVGSSTTVLTFNQIQMDSQSSSTNKNEKESNSSTNNSKNNGLSFFDQFEVKFIDRFKKKPELSCIFALSDIENGIEVVFCCEKPCEALSWVAVIHAWISRASATREAKKQVPISPLNSPSASPRRKSDYGAANKRLKFEFSSSSSDSYEYEESSGLINFPKRPKQPTKIVNIQKARSNFQIAPKRIVLNNRLNKFRPPPKKLLLNINMNSYSDDDEESYNEYYSDNDDNNNNNNKNDDKKIINRSHSDVTDKKQENKKVLNNDKSKKIIEPKNIRNIKSDFDINFNQNDDNDNDNSKFIMDKIYDHYKSKNDKNNEHNFDLLINNNNNKVPIKNSDENKNGIKNHDNTQLIMDVLNSHYKAKNDKAKQMFQSDNESFIDNKIQLNNLKQNENKNEISSNINKDKNSSIEPKNSEISNQTNDSINKQNNVKHIKRKKRVKKRSSSLSNKLNDMKQATNISSRKTDSSNKQNILMQQTNSPNKQIIKNQTSNLSDKSNNIKQTENILSQKTDSSNKQNTLIQPADSLNKPNDINQAPNKQIIKNQTSNLLDKSNNIKQTENILSQKTDSSNKQNTLIQPADSLNKPNDINQAPNKQIIKNQTSNLLDKSNNIKQTENILSQKTDSSNKQNTLNQLADSPNKQIIKTQTSNLSAKLNDIKQTFDISSQKKDSLNQQKNSIQSTTHSNIQNNINQTQNKQIIKRQSSSPSNKSDDIKQAKNISNQKTDSSNKQTILMQPADLQNNQNKLNQTPNKQIIKSQSSSPPDILNNSEQRTNITIQKMDLLNQNEISIQPTNFSTNQNDINQTQNKQIIIKSQSQNPSNFIEKQKIDISNTKKDQPNKQDYINQTQNKQIIIKDQSSSPTDKSDYIKQATNTQQEISIESTNSSNNQNDKKKTKRKKRIKKRVLNSSTKTSEIVETSNSSINDNMIEQESNTSKQINDILSQSNDKEQTTNINHLNEPINECQMSEQLNKQNQITDSLNKQINVNQTVNSFNEQNIEKQTSIQSSNEFTESIISEKKAEMLNKQNIQNQTLNLSDKQNKMKSTNSLNTQNNEQRMFDSSNEQINHNRGTNSFDEQNKSKFINAQNNEQQLIDSSNETNNESQKTPIKHEIKVSINHQFNQEEPINFDKHQENVNNDTSFKFASDGLDLSFHSFVSPTKSNESSPEKQRESFDLLIPYLDNKSNEKEENEINYESTKEPQNDLNINNENSIEALLFEARMLIDEIQNSTQTSKLKLETKPIIVNNFIHQDVIDSSIKSLVVSFKNNSNSTTENEEEIDYVNSFQQCDERTIEEVISSSLQKFENTNFDISNFVKISDFHSFDFDNLLKTTTIMKRPIVEEYAFTIQQIVSLANNEHLSIVRRIGVSINEFINKYAKHGNKNSSITVTESSESLRLCFLISAVFLNGLNGFNSFGLENEFLDALKALTVHINSLEEIYKSVSTEKTILTQISKFVILLLNSQSLNFVLESILDNEKWISDYYSTTSYLRDEETLKQIVICNSVIQYMNFDINENTNIIVNVSHEDKLKFVFRPAYSFLEIDSITRCQNKDKIKNDVVEFFLKELIYNSNGKGWQFLCLLADSNHVKLNCEVKLLRESILNAKKNVASSENDEKRIRAVLDDGLKYGLIHIWFIIMFTNQELTQQFFNKDSFFVDLYRANHILEAFAKIINDYLLIY